MLSSPKRGSIRVVNIERKSYILEFWYKMYLKSIKKKCNTGNECNKEPKQTKSLIKKSTEDNIYNKVVSKVC